MRNNKTNLSLILVFSVFVVLGCSTVGKMTEAKPAATRAIDEFHKLFNDGNLDKIYADAASEFRDAAQRADFDALMNAVAKKLGRVKSTKNQTWKVNTYNLTTAAVMVQETEFESGSGVETFTFRMDGDKAILLGYNINSNDLITK